ncbi:MAG: beta-lactamase family protein, partial [Ferruginibacter sp.]|nr:beta-lactamase family protein [Cytophagales bacterium]
MKTGLLTLLLLVLSGTVFPCRAQPRVDVRRIDSTVTRFLKEAKVPGAAIAVLKRGELLYVGAYGFSNLELNTLVSQKTVFELASLTKQMTAALVVTLAHERKLSLEDKLVAYVDDAPAAWNPITVRQLLGHMAGLEMAFEPKMNGSYLLNYSKEVMLKAAKETPMHSTPGTDWEYSDEGYFLAGVVVEKA